MSISAWVSVHVCVVCTPACMCMPSHGRRETCLPWHMLRSQNNFGELSLSTGWILGTEFRLSCLTPSSSPHWAILPVFLLAFINTTFFFPVGWVSPQYISLVWLHKSWPQLHTLCGPTKVPVLIIPTNSLPGRSHLKLVLQVIRTPSKLTCLDTFSKADSLALI